jgi:hypothetical protein
MTDGGEGPGTSDAGAPASSTASSATSVDGNDDTELKEITSGTNAIPEKMSENKKARVFDLMGR